MQNELVELLKYHVRQLINSCSMSDTDAINWLKNELSLSFWSSFNTNLDARTIYNSENKSTTRILKKQFSKIHIDCIDCCISSAVSVCHYLLQHRPA